MESKWSGGGGSGTLTGPGSSTDNAIVRWNGTSGDAGQDSVVIISDTGAVTGVTTVNDTTIPSSKTLVTTTDTLAVMAATTSLQLKTLITDETGSGALVFADSPVFTTPNIGSAIGSISGNSATVTTNADLTGPVTSTGNATAIANGAISNAMLANSAVANLSGTNTGDQAVSTLTDTAITSATVNDVLSWNGVAWVNTPNQAAVGAGAVDLYLATPITIAASTNCAIALGTLSPTPVITGDVVTTTSLATNTVAISAWRSAALGRSSVPAGLWAFESHVGVNSIAGGRVTTILRNIYQATATLSGTVTITGSGTTRTVTASSGTPFATANITASATAEAAAYLQTPQGVFQISARTSDTVVTITVLSGYANETAVSFSTWQYLFGARSSTVTSISPSYSQIEWNTIISAYAINLTDSLGSITFGTSNNTTTLSTVYNGIANHSVMSTTFTILHNELPGLNGGSSNEYYHLTSAEYVGTGTGIFVRKDAPTFTGTVAGITSTMVGLGNVDNTSDATKNAARVTLTNKTITDPIIDDGLRLNHETSVTTPASGKLAVFAKNDDKLYMTNSSGITTAVASSGTGEKNYVTNPSAASAVTGWTAVSHMTVARTTTAGDLPREYTTATGIKITATASQTQDTTTYVYYDFTLDDIDLNKKLKIEWSQKQTGTYAASDLAVIITTQADRANALHTPVTTLIPAADGVFTTSFDSSSTATLSLVIRATTNMADNGGIVISDVVVGPGTITQGAAVSEWVSYTPTLGNLTLGNGTLSAQYARVGSNLLARIKVLFGSTTSISADPTFTLPTGLTLDNTTIPTSSGSVFGQAALNDTGTQGFFGVVTQSGSATDKVSVLAMDDGTNGVYTGSITATLPFTWTTNDWIYLQFTVPISQWAGNGVVNLGAGAQVEYVSNSDNDNLADTTNFAYGPAGSLLLATTPAGTQVAKRVRFQYPIQVDDLLIVEVSDDRIVWHEMPTFVSSMIENLRYDGTNYIGMGAIQRINTTDIDVYFGKYRTGTATAWSDTAYWRVRKAKASSPVGFGLASSTASGLTPATAVLGLLRYNTSNGYGSTNTCIRRFSTLVSNTSTVTYADSSTSGTDFTIGISGIYAITYVDEFNAAATMGISKNSSQLTSNISAITAADRLSMVQTSGADAALCCSWTGYLASGDILRAHTNTALAGANPIRSSFTIQRIA